MSSRYYSRQVNLGVPMPHEWHGREYVNMHGEFRAGLGSYSSQSLGSKRFTRKNSSQSVASLPVDEIDREFRLSPSLTAEIVGFLKYCDEKRNERRR